jgi:hypothetical protein
VTVALILAVIIPWSIWRQMHARPVTTEGLVKLPLIFAAVAVISLATDVPAHTPDALVYDLVCAVLAIGFGAWRGRRVTLTHDGTTPIQQGNRVTLISWGVMIGLKVALGTVAAVTGWIPSEGAGEIFAFLALTFMAQSAVVATRTRGSRLRVHRTVAA